MVLVPDPACSGGWTLSVVLALQADDMVVVQHTSGEKQGWCISCKPVIRHPVVLVGPVLPATNTSSGA
jgi:hypothetical protein